MDIITKLKKKFGYYKENKIYVIHRDYIKKNPIFKVIGKEKYKRKWEYYRNTGEFESQIVLRKNDWMIIDGYSTYVISGIAGVDKVEVIFRN